MPFVVVVRRDEPALFSYLHQHFQEPEVTVVLDRRHGERRRSEETAPVDRRRKDRRAIPSEEDPLWKYGFRVSVARA
ncbi:MAG TPA: hypothetical protein VGW35_07850 [Methylomirabilota bacterium]|nr:hypothetical protein [Methylomirabilota bacterium]